MHPPFPPVEFGGTSHGVNSNNYGFVAVSSFTTTELYTSNHVSITTHGGPSPHTVGSPRVGRCCPAHSTLSAVSPCDVMCCDVDVTWMWHCRRQAVCGKGRALLAAHQGFSHQTTTAVGDMCVLARSHTPCRGTSWCTQTRPGVTAAQRPFVEFCCM